MESLLYREEATEKIGLLFNLALYLGVVHKLRWNFFKTYSSLC